MGPSYQLSYSSLPFMAAGKLGGLTLKKQFQRAFELHSQAALDYLFVGTFNEHIAQPQPNPYNPPNGDAVAMGLENDPFNVKLWVDMYGDAISRDLEPTREDGGKMWTLFQSCMRVIRSMPPVTSYCIERVQREEQAGVLVNARKDKNENINKYV